jgi:hypothetical protein
MAKLLGVEVAPDGPFFTTYRLLFDSKVGTKFGCPCAEDKRELWELGQKQKGRRADGGGGEELRVKA